MILNKIQVLCRRLNRLIQEHARAVSQSNNNSKVEKHDSTISVKGFLEVMRGKRETKG